MNANEFLKELESRRSVRSYKSDPVPKELIERIVRAGTYAPTGMGRQSPVIVAVTDKAVRDSLSRLNASIMGSAGDPFYGAPAVLLVLADKTVPTCVYDGSLVMGELMHAAHALGLGSCWIHRAREEFETPEGKALLERLGLDPERYVGIGHCILGYANGPEPAPKPRKEGWVRWVE